MAPSPATEDYYEILEVSQTATLDQITASYRRLALKHHPDRGGSTRAFQLLGQAYETLNDEDKRREYDLIYPSITRSRVHPQSTQTPRPPRNSPWPSEAVRQATEIAELQKEKEQRAAQWIICRNAFEASISKLQRGMRKLEQEIAILASFAAAEAAEEASKNSWGTWVISPLYKKRIVSEEEKSRKDRERQERMVEKSMKERRLGVQQAELMEQDNRMRKAKEDYETANTRIDQKVQLVEFRKRNREYRERLERENAERERQAQILLQMLEQRARAEREAKEHARKQKAEARAAERARQEEMARLQRRLNELRSASASACSHAGWWNKVQGRTACSRCYDVWSYLLQCPGCGTKACPKCQGELRPRFETMGFSYDYDSGFMFG